MLPPHKTQLPGFQARPGTVWIGRLPSSPIGPIWAAVSPAGLLLVEWDMPQADFARKVQRRLPTRVEFDPVYTAEPLRQIADYLSGRRLQFEITLDMAGMSTFQRQVLQLTLVIPYGHTSTYQQVARQAGRPRAARAVGRVEATNPIPLVIPCHRVLGSDGKLHGYGGPGGIQLKAWLLDLEQRCLKQNLQGPALQASQSALINP